MFIFGGKHGVGSAETYLVLPERTIQPKRRKSWWRFSKHVAAVRHRGFGLSAPKHLTVSKSNSTKLVVLSIATGSSPELMDCPLNGMVPTVFLSGRHRYIQRLSPSWRNQNIIWLWQYLVSFFRGEGRSRLSGCAAPLSKHTGVLLLKRPPETYPNWPAYRSAFRRRLLRGWWRPIEPYGKRGNQWQFPAPIVLHLLKTVSRPTVGDLFSISSIRIT